MSGYGCENPCPVPARFACGACSAELRELNDLREQLTEHERTRTTGGPPPATTDRWENRDSGRPATADDPNAPPLATERSSRREPK